MDFDKTKPIFKSKDVLEQNLKLKIYYILLQRRQKKQEFQTKETRVLDKGNNSFILQYLLCWPFVGLIFLLMYLSDYVYAQGYLALPTGRSIAEVAKIRESAPFLA